MSVANPLVADVEDNTSAVAGAHLLQDVEDIAKVIESGDWGAGALAVTSTALDAVGAISDPLGTLVSYGLGWVLDHVEPLKGWLNDFTGDAAEVAAFSGTWANTSTHLHSLSEWYRSSLGDLEGLSGQTIDAYLVHAGAVVGHLKGAGDGAGAMATGLQLASTIVQMVHDIIRDVLSELVGSAISAATTSAFTFGFGAPLAMGQFGIKVARMANKVERIVQKVVDALTQLKRLLGKLAPSIEKALDALAALLRRGSTPHYSGPEGWRPLTRADVDSLPILRDGSHMTPDGALKPNSWYKSGEHEYIYHVDENGHIDRFHAEELHLKEHEGRHPHDPNTPGKGPDDHAGHLAGDWAGGSPQLANMR